MNATLTDMLWLEKDEIPQSQLEALRQKLTTQPMAYRGEASPPICLVLEEHGRVGLPLWEGLKFFQMEAGHRSPAAAFRAVSNWSSEGHCIARYVKRRPAPRNPDQAVFFQDMHREAAARPAILCEAPTGSGKTVAGVNTIALLGATALVLVPRKRIAKQWREALEGFLGIHPSKIGTVAEGKFEWKGKAVVVAVIHNLVNKPAEELPDGFLDYFGTVIWDEAHNLGARTFSQSMRLCRARHRIALSATPKRGDGCEQVFYDYFGRPCVIYKGQAMPCTCRVFNFFWTFPNTTVQGGSPFQRKKNDLNSKPPTVLRKILISSDRRNRFLAKLIKQLYDAGRNVLVIGDEVLHLQVLMGMVIDLGVNGEELGLYTGSYRDAEGKSRKMLDSQLDWVAANSRVIFATYGMAGEALDIPRLDAGIDVTPHSAGVQPVGRIRRLLPDKPQPLWLTIRDVGIKIFERAAMSRLRGLREANVTIIEQPNGPKTNKENSHAA